jgi:Methyltransferase domain
LFSQFSSQLYLGEPSATSAMQIYASSWKYEYDKLDIVEIRERALRDRRPNMVEETFGSLRGKTVLELGPADGYNTVALENLGANVRAVEGNVDAFLRCLILKNALKLQAEFWLGDFCKEVESGRKYDILYASGVLYHLLDPVDFLAHAIKCSDKLFLWTHYFDERFVYGIEHERVGFADRKTSVRTVLGKSFTYHHKSYDTNHVKLLGYIGGLNSTCCWLSREDLFGALELVGYKVQHMVESAGSTSMMPAVSILAQRR